MTTIISIILKDFKDEFRGKVRKYEDASDSTIFTEFRSPFRTSDRPPLLYPPGNGF